MNEWMEVFISQCLADVPRGRYRRRTEKELRDHMMTLCQDLTEAEVLQRMGDPGRLRVEYEVAWERSLPARLEELGRCLVIWAVGWAVMLGTHLLISSAIGRVWEMSISLPGDSMDPQVRMIRNTLGTLNNSPLWSILPFISALILGVCYLGHSFRRSRHPVREISVGLSLYGTFLYCLLCLYVGVSFHHRTMWEAFTNSAAVLFVILLCCVLLGIAIGRRVERRRELA